MLLSHLSAFPHIDIALLRVIKAQMALCFFHSQELELGQLLN